LTSASDGTGLPRDARGSVGRVRDERPDDPPATTRIEHDVPGTPYDEELPGVERASAERMKGPPVYVEMVHAEILVAQFRETAAYRRWQLLAVAVMANHVHLVVRAPEGAAPTKVLGDFKAYGSRALSARFGKPASGTWWTYGGSKRLLKNDEAISNAIHYVLHKQYNPLITWSPSES